MPSWDTDYAVMPATTVWWDGGWESPQAMQAEIDKAQAYQNAAPARWDEYVKQAGGIDKVAPAGSSLDSQIKGGQIPDVRNLAGGKTALATSHWDGGTTGYNTPDGRIVQERLGEPEGHWDNQTQKSLGYTLRDPDPRAPKDWGLNLNPTAAKQMEGKKLNRWENFDTAGKSDGYGYQLYDDRGFFQQLIQDLGPVLLAPLMSGLGPLVQGGISNLLPNLGALPTKMLSSGLLQGGISALGGGDPLKAALTGAIGVGANPVVGSAVSGLGLDNPILEAALQGGAVSGIKAILQDKDLLQGVLSGAITSGAGVYADGVDSEALNAGIKAIPLLLQSGKITPAQLMALAKDL